MEENKRTTYNHTKVEDKYFFGGYFNLAQNNIESLKSAYKERFKDGPFLSKFKKNKLADTDFNLRVDYLGRYLPFIHFLDKRDRQKFVNILELFINTIDDLRNFYTHYSHNQLNFEKLYEPLDDIFLKVVKDVRKNRFKTDQTKLLLKGRLNDELVILIRKRREKLELAKNKLKNNRISLNEEHIENGVYNAVFHHLIYKDKSSGKEYVSKYYKSQFVEDTQTEYKQITNGITISKNGLVFLLSLFLTKKESEDLRSQVEGFKAKVKGHIGVDNYPNEKDNSLKYMATHWVFSYLAFKEVKNQLVSSYSKEALLMQIADELSKVPDGVYKTLSKEDQDCFVENINEYIKDGDDDYTLSQSVVIHPVIRRRYEDKFSYFALRYLDECAEFPTLRFQIYLGNYVHDRRDKQIAGTIYHTDRLVKEKINVFAKLSEATQLKDEFFKNKDTNDISGWERFPNPSYNIENGNIMVSFKVGEDHLKKKIKSYQEKRQNSKRQTRIRKYEIVGEIGKIGKKDTINYAEPVAVFSLNELPALLYEVLKKSVNPSEIESKLQERLKEQFDRIEKSLPNDVSTSDIPLRLRRSQNSQSSIDIPKLLRAVQDEISITEQKLELIKNNIQETKSVHEKGKTTRKYVFNSKELGQETTWLAKDIIRFMPVDIRKEWKGYQHSQLQQSLAFYERRPEEASELLNAAWNFQKWSEDFQYCFKEKNFESFFQKYLEQRKDVFKYIENMINNFQSEPKIFKKGLKDYRVWNLFPKRNFAIDTTESIKEKLLAQPIPLGRGIFDKKPTFIKGCNLEKDSCQFADWYSYANSKNIHFQEFYDSEKYIHHYGELFEENQCLSKNERKETIEKLKIENELFIKKIKMHDVFLKLIFDNLYKKVFPVVENTNLSSQNNLELKDFYISRDERLRIEGLASTQSQKEYGDNSENVIKENCVWNLTIPYYCSTIYEPRVKLKDVGKFRRFIADTRVQEILRYNPEKKWTKLELEKELESYEKIRREEFLEEIQLLEHYILESSEKGFNNSENGNPNFKNDIVKLLENKFKNYVSTEDRQWLKNISEKDYESSETYEKLKAKPNIMQKAFILVYLRNKICHNQMPTLELFNFLLHLVGYERTIEQTYSQAILECTHKIICEFNS